MGERDGVVEDGVAVDMERTHVDEPLLGQRVHVLQQSILWRAVRGARCAVRGARCAVRGGKGCDER